MLKGIIRKITPSVFIEFGSYSCKFANSENDKITSHLSLIAVSSNFEKYQTIEEYFDPLPKKNLKVYYPFENGRISHYKSTEIFLNIFLTKHLTLMQSKFGKFLGLDAYFSVHKPTSEVQISSIIDVMNSIGANSVNFVYEGVASFKGAIKSDRGVLLHMGYSSSVATVMEKTKIVQHKHIDFGGNDILVKLKNYIRKKYQLEIPMKDVEKIMQTIDISIDLRTKKKDLSLTGKSLSDGKPVTITIAEFELASIIRDSLNVIVDLIDSIIIDLPSEFSNVISAHGVIMTGGVSEMQGIAEYLKEATKINFTKNTTPTKSVVDGLKTIAADSSLSSELSITDYILL